MSEKTKSMSHVKHIPKDAQVIMSIMKDMGITDYEPKVINQLLEFTYRYVTCILDDSKVYANHAKKKFIDLDDVRLAVKMQLERSFTNPPPRDVLLDVARTKNNIPLPFVKPNNGLRLPPDRYCLNSTNYRLKNATKKVVPKPAHPLVSNNQSGGQPRPKVEGNKTSVSIVKRPTLATVARTQTISIPKPVLKYSTERSHLLRSPFFIPFHISFKTPRTTTSTTTTKAPVTKPKIQISSNQTTVKMETVEIEVLTYENDKLKAPAAVGTLDTHERPLQWPTKIYRDTTVPGHSEVNLCSMTLQLGKDISKTSMPVIFNEPLSFLQRVAEYMEYAVLLKQAAQQESPVSRLQYVAAFAVSALASNWERFGKPFNPILGETYELQREDFRIICEQVSHHPPVSAFYADSEDFIFHGSIHPKLKFWGKSLEVHPKGVVTVELPKWKESYTWQNVNCILHNVLVGQLWMEQSGPLEIRQHGGDNLKAKLCFIKSTLNGKDVHRVEGFITNQEHRKLLFLYGQWTEILRSCEPSLYEETLEKIKLEAKSPQGSPGHKKVLAKLHSLKVGAFKPLHQDAIEEPFGSAVLDDIPIVDEIPGSITLWKATPRPSNSSDYYQFTTFAMSLNELEPEMEEGLCPTDSRLRPDIRKLENGDQDGAASEKTRLEEKQRNSRKARKQKKGNEYVPRWFQSGTNPYTGQEDWIYLGGYWDRNYTDVEDIF